MAEKVKIAELSIDSGELLTSLEGLKKKIQDVKDAQKVMKITGDENTKAFIQNEAQLKTLNGAYGAQIKVLQAVTTTTKELGAEINKEVRSLDEAAKNNKKLKETRNQLNVSTKEGKKQLELINKKLNDNTKFIKENTSDLEKQKQNVGNYGSALSGATGGLGAFGVALTKGKAILTAMSTIFSGHILQLKAGTAQMFNAAAGTSGLTAAQTASTVATNILSGAMKVLKFALIATGIGAIVVVLGSLIGMLANTQEGTDKVSQVMDALGAAFSVIIDRVSQFGGAVVKFFSGDFSGGFNDMKDALSGVGDEMVREAGLAYELQQAFQAVRDAEMGLIVVSAERRKEIAKLKLDAKDETLSLKDRAAALEEAGRLEIANMEDKKRILQEQIRISNAQLKLGNSTQEETERGLQLEASLLDAETASLKLRKGIATELNSLRKMDAAENAKVIAAKKKEQEEKDKRDEADLLKIEEARQKELDDTEAFEKLKKEIEDERRLADAESEQEREEIALELQLEKDIAELEKITADAEERNALKLMLEENYQDALLELQIAKQKAGDDAVAKAFDAELKKKNKHEGEVFNIANAFAQKTLGLLGDSLFARIAGIGVEAALKIAQVKMSEKQANAEVASSTNIAIAKAIAASPLTLGQPLAGVLLAAGAAATGGNIASSKIATQSILKNAAIGAAGAGVSSIKFADGGILSGASHAAGGIPTPYGELEGGEAIINTRSTALFAPLLSAINEAGGGKKFADGGILGSEMAGAGGLDYDRIAEAMAALPAPRVAVDEIAEVSNRVSIIESQATT